MRKIGQLQLNYKLIEGTTKAKPRLRGRGLRCREVGSNWLPKFCVRVWTEVCVCAGIKPGANNTRTVPRTMQIENIIKDFPLPPMESLSNSSNLPPPPLPPLPAIPSLPAPEHLGLPVDGPPQFPSQLLQLKWQLFCVQKSQQELASAILQLSSMILANSAPQLSPPFLPSQQQQHQLPLSFPTSKSPGKRRWSSKDRGSSSQPKYPMMYTKSKIAGLVAPCQCDACQKGEGESLISKPPEGVSQSPLDLYVSYFLNSLENRQLPLPPSMAVPQPLMEKPPSQQQVS